MFTKQRGDQTQHCYALHGPYADAKGVFPLLNSYRLKYLNKVQLLAARSLKQIFSSVVLACKHAKQKGCIGYGNSLCRVTKHRIAHECKCRQYTSSNHVCSITITKLTFLEYIYLHILHSLEVGNPKVMLLHIYLVYSDIMEWRVRSFHQCQVHKPAS